MENLERLQERDGGEKELECELDRQLYIADKSKDIQTKLLVESIKNELREQKMKKGAAQARSTGGGKSGGARPTG